MCIAEKNSQKCTLVPKVLLTNRVSGQDSTRHKVAQESPKPESTEDEGSFQMVIWEGFMVKQLFGLALKKNKVE